MAKKQRHRRSIFKSKKIRLIVLIGAILGMATFGLRIKPPQPATELTKSLEQQVIIQHEIKIEAIPELYYAKGVPASGQKKQTASQAHLPSSITIDLDIESYEHSEIVHQKIEDICLLNIGNASLDPSSWQPYLHSDYKIKGKLVFVLNKEEVATASSFELYIFDPDERIFKWALLDSSSDF